MREYEIYITIGPAVKIDNMLESYKC